MKHDGKPEFKFKLRVKLPPGQSLSVRPGVRLVRGLVSDRSESDSESGEYAAKDSESRSPRLRPRSGTGRRPAQSVMVFPAARVPPASSESARAGSEKSLLIIFPME